MAPVARTAGSLIAAVLLTSPSGGQAPCTAKGAERWTVKTTAPKAGSSAHHLTVGALGTLDPPADAISGKKGAKMLETRYTTPVGGLHEGQLVSVTGWVRLIKTSSDDCDYHIQIEPTKTGHDGMVIVEIPEPDSHHVTDPALRAKLLTARDDVRTGLKLPHEPSKTGNVIGSAYMTFTGALFFDAPHYPHCGSRGSGDTAVTCWEVHPVTAAKFAPKP